MASSSTEHVFKKPYDLYKENSTRMRWRTLSRAVKRDNENDPGAFRFICNLGQRFISFSLFTVTDINTEEFNEPDGAWLEYKSVLLPDYSVKIRRLKQRLTLRDLVGFDNSGTVWVWPSEEVLAFYSILSKEIFSGKSVLELGGGMSCLAGLMIAKYANPSKVELTDGNRHAVENLYKILNNNNDIENVSCSLLKWGQNARFRDVRSRYDYIIAADCLYMQKYRHRLLSTIKIALNEGGRAIIFAPQRGNDVTNFEREARLNGFDCEKDMQYNDYVWEQHVSLKVYHKYDDNKHYPIMILLTKAN